MLAATEIINWIIWPIVCLASIGMMGMFAGLELGSYVMNKFRIELHAEANNPSALRMRKMMKNPDRLLSTLLIGTNINAYLSTFSISAMFVAAGREDQAELFTLAIATPLLFVFSDSVPKNVYRRQAEQLVYRYSIVLEISDKIFRLIGLSQLVQFASKSLLFLLGRKGEIKSHIGHDGMQAVLAEGAAAGALTANQANIAGRIISIADLSVADIMQPMQKVITADLNVSRKDFITLIRQHDYSRIPLLDSDNKVAGIVDIYDILVDEKLHDPACNMIPPITIACSSTITEALYLLQRARRSIAIACDDQNNHVGIFTIKDLVEEIVGEIDEW